MIIVLSSLINIIVETYTIISRLSTHFEPGPLVCTWLVGAYFTHIVSVLDWASRNKYPFNIHLAYLLRNIGQGAHEAVRFVQSPSHRGLMLIIKLRQPRKKNHLSMTNSSLLRHLLNLKVLPTSKALISDIDDQLLFSDVQTEAN
jgi:hypothetical protein